MEGGHFENETFLWSGIEHDVCVDLMALSLQRVQALAKRLRRKYVSVEGKDNLHEGSRGA
jgi:hypothetical protein